LEIEGDEYGVDGVEYIIGKLDHPKPFRLNGTAFFLTYPKFDIANEDLKRFLLAKSKGYRFLRIA